MVEILDKEDGPKKQRVGVKASSAGNCHMKYEKEAIRQERNQELATKRLQLKL
ncbi:Hypothetical protein CINCED_3A024002 [Cinara cedri]|uniref:Uncharacterized protein n=1 Tax=Cinara cedri TaxID=506608 RepID=A0A5E4MU29_9HEMI|nr:Hypothetical protein CINCED_3A024002 [Cinara cedri]